MNTMLYRCTDLDKTGLRFISGPYNQFILDNVTFFENPHKKLSFINIFSIQRRDFDDHNKGLLGNSIRFDPNARYAYRPYDGFKQYFEPICDLADYRIITEAESVLYDRDAIFRLHFAYGNMLYLVNSNKKKSLTYVLYKINQRTTRDLTSFFLTDQEECFLKTLANHGMEAFANEYNTSIPDVRKEYFIKTAKALLSRKQKIDHFSDRLIHQRVEIESKLEKLL